MTYKDVAVYNERKLKSKLNRYKILLYNAITLLEQQDLIDNLADELGITEKEYEEIMENDNTTIITRNTK